MNESAPVRPEVWPYRTACVVLWLTGLMHSAAMLTAAPDFPGEDGRELTRLMNSYKIPLPRCERSMHELISGYSWQFAAGLFGIGLIAACAGWPAAGDPAVRRRVAAAGCVVLAVFVAIAWKYFFIVPLACQGLACVLMGLSAAMSRRN